MNLVTPSMDAILAGPRGLPTASPLTKIHTLQQYSIPNGITEGARRQSAIWLSVCPYKFHVSVPRPSWFVISPHAGPSMEPRPFSRGNPRPVDPARSGLDPSMEPRPFSRGNRASRKTRSDAGGSFNGAATFQSRKPEGRRDSHRCFHRLQWSRDLSVAETSTASSDTRTPAHLQWSRDLSVAETSRWFEGPFGFVLPSMEPRPFSRGNPLNPLPNAFAKPPFNGAATFQSRKPAKSAGRISASSTSFNGAATFQSRKPSVGCQDWAVSYLPSMEPRPFSRGNHQSGHRIGAEVHPSMEPRPFSRGNP